MGEGLVFAAVFLLLPVWLLFYPKIASFAIGMDFAVLTLLSVVCAACERRGDVLLSLPGYELLRFIDCSVFLYSFWKIVIQRKQVRGWFAVQRY